MKRLTIVLVIVLAVAFPAMAGPTTYSHTLEMYRTLDNFWWDSDAPISKTWEHAPLDNPVSNDNWAQEKSGSIKLLPKIDLEQAVANVRIRIAPNHLKIVDNWQPLGILNIPDNTNNWGVADEIGQDKQWLDGLKVHGKINWARWRGRRNKELGNATLPHCPTIIPAPGAILLGGIGVGLVGWLRRRNTI